MSIARPLQFLAALGAAFAVLGGGAALAVPTTGPVHTAEKKDLVTFGLGPGGQSFADRRPALAYSGSAGSSLVDRVAVYNQSDVPLDLLVYASDAVNSRGGGFGLRPRSEPNRDMGGWLALGQAATAGRRAADGRSTVRVHVPAQSKAHGIGRVLVPLDVIVPADATPGDHAAGIVASLISTGKNPGSQNIELEQRVALKVYFRVAGQVHRGLAVKILNRQYVGGSGLGLHGRLRVTYRVRNTGNVRLGAVTSLRTKGPFGVASRTITGPKVDELVPGGSADLRVDVKDVYPTGLGWADLEVTAVAPPEGERPGLRPVSDAVRFWAITWQEVVLLLLLSLGLAYRRWRRTRRPSGKHVRDPAPSASRPRAVVGAGVTLLALVLAVGGKGEAHADVLGPLQMWPLSGTDTTLFNGYLARTACPRGTTDSYWTIDGPDLPRDTAFLAPGNRTGTGPQMFRNAAIANLRTVNSGAFTRSGTYHVRFSCFGRKSVTDTYQVSLRYHAGGAGRFQVVGATRIPSKVLDPTYDANPAGVGPAAGVGAGAPGAAESASPRPPAAGGGSSAGSTSSEPAPAEGERHVASSSSGGSGAWWIALLGLVPLLAGTVVLVRRARA